MKTQTIARLELQAAFLGARYFSLVIEESRVLTRTTVKRLIFVHVQLSYFGLVMLFVPTYIRTRACNRASVSYDSYWRVRADCELTY